MRKNWLQICRCSCLWYCGFAYGSQIGRVQNGDKVFCSDMTFAATVNPVVYEGGVPVFIDAEYATWNIDPAALSKAF